MPTNDEAKLTAVQALTSTNLGYNGDWLSLFNLYGIPGSDFNGRLLDWANGRLSKQYTNLQDALNAVALLEGVASWGQLGTFSPSSATLDLNFETGRYFANGVVYSSIAALVAGLSGTYTRATSATYFDSAGTLQTAASGTARVGTVPGLTTRMGYLAEEARQNDALWNRDLTNAAWVKTTATAAKDQTGIDGVASSASSLTATAGNATCLQTVVLASSARFQSAYVKRLVGSGTVEMTTDNRVTWTPVTVTSAWTRVTIPTQTLINPIFGFRIVTSGDSIAVDYVQNETGAFATSPIATTTGAVTRNADVLNLPATGWYSATAGTFYAEYITNVAGATVNVATLYSADTLERIDLQINTAALRNPRTVKAGAAVTSMTVGTYTTLTLDKFAAAFADGNSATVVNGGAVTTNATTSNMPTGVATLSVGSRNGTGPLSGLIRRIFYLPTRQADAVIQGWTA